MILSGRPWKFGLQYWHYVESLDTFGPDYQVRFSISLAVILQLADRDKESGGPVIAIGN